jgi:ribonuclease HI
MIRIWTDGACLNNGRKNSRGGWAFVVEVDGQIVHKASGAEAPSTNNRMEITAALEGLRWFAGEYSRLPVEVITDSRYVHDAATSWIKGWKKRGWHRSGRRGGRGKAVINTDLWKQLDPLLTSLAPTWRWVRGHVGHEFNEVADLLAVTAAKGGVRL